MTGRFFDPGIPRPMPPEVMPLEDETRWEWLRQAMYYAYRAAEACIKMELELRRLQSDLSGHIGDSSQDEVALKQKMEDLEFDLKHHREEIEEKVIKPLNAIVLQQTSEKGKSDMAKWIAFGVIAFVFQIVSAVIVSKITHP